MYDLDSHFWDRAKQTWREAKDRHKHTVPQALSLMGGQSTLVRLPAPLPRCSYLLHTHSALARRGKFLLFHKIRWWVEFCSWANLRRARADPSRARALLPHSISLFIIFAKGAQQKYHVVKGNSFVLSELWLTNNLHLVFKCQCLLIGYCVYKWPRNLLCVVGTIR